MIKITEQEFKRLSAYIKQHYGIHLKEEKHTLVTGRLYKVLQSLNITSFSDYYQYILSDKTGRASEVLIDKISTNHTYFMRETAHLDYYRDNVLPDWRSKLANRSLQVWSAGCSTGEEPYTLSMITNDFILKEAAGWSSRILATDISKTVVDKAVRGVYTNEAISVLPEGWRRRYFHKVDDQHMAVSATIKKDVDIRIFNLMNKVFPYRQKFHAIFCRNVMIYFDLETKMELVNRFYDALESGGYLFIGHSETLERDRTKFKYIMPAVYRKE